MIPFIKNCSSRTHAGSYICQSSLRTIRQEKIRYQSPRRIFSQTTQPTQISPLVKLAKQCKYNELGSFPQDNIVDYMRNNISHELSTISDINAPTVFAALDWSSNLDKGDLLVPIPRLGKQNTNPKELAIELANNFKVNHLITKIEPNGVFLQFFFNPDFLFKTVIPDILIKKTDYGSFNLGENNKVVIEFSSPNIAKPFHAGHLRSTIIGGFLANLYEKLGWDVTRMNYLGDWGKQFGVLAIGFERYGSDEKLAKDPILHLFEVYVRINKDIEDEGGLPPQDQITNNKARQFFKKLEDGDINALKIWENFRKVSIEKYIATYSRLNIKYDVYSGESQVPHDLMTKAVEIFNEKGMIHKENGATLIDLTRFNKKLGKTIIQKSDGTTLYLTRDVGAAMDRYNKYHFHKMIYVIAAQQDLHTSQLFEILNQMGFNWAKRLQHINFGMVKGMSTRKGTVVFLDNILEEAKEKMLSVMQKNTLKYSQVENPEKVADLIGISAVMIQDMQSKRINNYEFKWERMLSFEGDTGPYLQYAHSRLRSLSRNSPEIDTSTLCEANFNLLKEPDAAALVRLLAQYPDILRNAMKTHEPSTIVTYLFKVAHQISTCYDILWVAGQPNDLAVARLALYEASRQVLYNGMRILGLTPVDRM